MKGKFGWVKNLLILAAVALSLVSCMSAKQLPEDYFYRLPLYQGSSAAKPSLAGMVGVARIETLGLLNERAILYSDQQNPLELRRYRYHHWQEAPASLIQKHLRTYLQQSGAAPGAVLYEPGLVVDQLIRGRLQQFERQLTGSGAKVVVRLELGFAQQAGRVYQAEVACTEMSMSATAEAFGRALAEIYQAFLAELRG
ncbi:MAG: ABC-type transport auxiliary lipoprotein family protein [Desulfobulbaceae bacterium]|nr:ABC-type transport auxiliary lipoprotein family protein [Desulfobulbaceae bacterium]